MFSPSKIIIMEVNKCANIFVLTLNPIGKVGDAFQFISHISSALSFSIFNFSIFNFSIFKRCYYGREETK